MAQAEICYHRLKGRDDLTPIEELFVVMVHLHLKITSYRLVELQVMASATADSHEHVLSLLDRYRLMLFPGSESKKQSGESEIKEALEFEMKKAFVIRRDESAGGHERLRRSGVGELFGEQQRKGGHTKAKTIISKPLPPGTTRWEDG